MILRSPSDIERLIELNNNTRILLWSEGERLKNRVIVQCSICEKIIETSIEKFVINNQKCDCQNKLEKQKLFLKDSFKFFKQCQLVHKNRYTYFDDYQGEKVKIKIFCTLCKKTFHQRAGSHLHDKQGCPFCVVSRVSLEFDSFLDRNEFRYEKEIRFEWCTSLTKRKTMIPYDYYLSDYNCIIELQGQQHYGIVPKFTPTLKDLEYRKEIDRRKAYLARVNGYNFLEIPTTNAKYESLIKQQILLSDIPINVIWKNTSRYDKYPVCKRVIDKGFVKYTYI